MNGGTRDWLEFATYDLESAEHLFYCGKHVYALYFCHLALEKLLKAKIEEESKKAPPETHNLRELVKLSGLVLPRDMLILLSRFDELNLVAMSVRNFGGLKDKIDLKMTEMLLSKTKEAFNWIKRYFKSPQK